MSSTHHKYNPYATQLFKLEVMDDATKHGQLVSNTRDAMHPNETIADDESGEEGGSDESN